MGLVIVMSVVLLVPLALSFTAYAFPASTDQLLRTLEKHEEPGSPEFWYKIIVSAILVLAGGVFAGYVQLDALKDWEC